MDSFEQDSPPRLSYIYQPFRKKEFRSTEFMLRVIFFFKEFVRKKEGEE